MKRDLRDSELLQVIMETLTERLPGVGICLLTFGLNDPSKANYVANTNREDTVKALFETAYRLKEKGFTHQ